MKSKRKFFEVKQGSTRIVFLIGSIAIKLPNFLAPEFAHFKEGFECNKSEADRKWRDDKFDLPKVYFGCSLFLVLERCDPISLDDYLYVTEHLYLNPYVRDLRMDNMGVTKKGQFVIIDWPNGMELRDKRMSPLIEGIDKRIEFENLFLHKIDTVNLLEKAKGEIDV